MRRADRGFVPGSRCTFTGLEDLVARGTVGPEILRSLQGNS